MLQHYATLAAFEDACYHWDTTPIDHKTEYYIFTVGEDVPYDTELRIQGDKWNVVDTWEVGDDNTINGVFLAREPYMFSRQLEYAEEELYGIIYAMTLPGFPDEDETDKLGPEMQAFRVGWLTAQHDIYEALNRVRGDN